MLTRYIESQIYRNGYAKALLDVKNWFERHSQSLKWCKMYNSKNIEMILSAISQNAEAFQEFGDDTAVFFKCDPKNKNKITEVFVKRECEDERFRKNDD